MGEHRRRQSRRTVLQTTGSVVALGTLTGTGIAAGAQQDEPADVPDERFDPPERPEDLAVELEAIDQFREVFSERRLAGLATLDAYVDGRVYEVSGITDSVVEEAMTEVDEPLVVFLAAKVNLEGSATGLVSPADIAEQATPIVRSEIEALGFEDIEEVEPREPRPDVEDGHVTEYRGTYSTTEIEAEADRADGEPVQLRAPAQDIEVAGFLTVWKPDDGTAIIAGGAYPDEDVDIERRQPTAGETGDGIDDVGEDLTLDPGAYRAQLVTLAEAVE